MYLLYNMYIKYTCIVTVVKDSDLLYVIEYKIWYRHSGQPDIERIPYDGPFKSEDEREIAADVDNHHITHMYIKNGHVPSLIT